MRVDLRNHHRDHAHSGRRARAVGRLAAYGHSGAGDVQCFNAAGAQPPPGDGPGPGEAATIAQREGWWLVGWLLLRIALTRRTTAAKASSPIAPIGVPWV